MDLDGLKTLKPTKKLFQVKTTVITAYEESKRPKIVNCFKIKEDPMLKNR